MTDSIIAAVSRFLTPEVIGKIASATGLDSATAQKAANASVPAILGGLADLAAKPGGARQLASAIAEQPSGLLSTLTNAIGGNAQLPGQRQQHARVAAGRRCARDAGLEREQVRRHRRGIGTQPDGAAYAGRAWRAGPRATRCRHGSERAGAHAHGPERPDRCRPAGRPFQHARRSRVCGKRRSRRLPRHASTMALKPAYTPYRCSRRGCAAGGQRDEERTE